MLDLVGNPNCWFCHAQAQIICISCYAARSQLLIKQNLIIYIMMTCYTIQEVFKLETKLYHYKTCLNEKYYLYSYSKTSTLINCTAVTADLDLTAYKIK